MDNMTIDNYDAPSCVPRIIETYPPQASAIKSMRKSTSDSNKLEDSTVIASLNHANHVDNADYANHVDYATGVSSTSVHSDFDALDNHSVQKNIGSLNYSLKPFPKNVVIGSSANDGVGLSTTLALLASHISSKKYVVALIDADISNGGLDVLLGLEQDEGRRLQEVQAPLG